MTVLYRTYRPGSWSDVIGQDQVVDTLRQSVAQGRPAHAYLFSGSRGTGKTSVARILAQDLKTATEDIYEIDAASNRGIDDIRELREHVSTSPFSSIYKVYIIDEVHMLSKDAWNALLKTLEEPPAHVIFILATTELDKVPDTIISRCQTFVFKKPSREVIRKQVVSIAKKEGYDIDAGASDLIALLGDGSFRDALGVLEKIISSIGETSSKSTVLKKIVRAQVEAITGAPGAQFVNVFIQSILNKDTDGALLGLGTADNAGISMNIFASLVLEKLRFILLIQHSASSKVLVSERVSDDDMKFIETEAQKKTLTPSILVTFLEATDQVNRAQISVLPLELAVVKVCSLVG